MGDARRMVREGVVHGRRRQADKNRPQLQRDDAPVSLVQIRILVAQVPVQEPMAKHRRDERRNQVRVDVARLVVQVRPALQAAQQRVRLAPVAAQDERVDVVPFRHLIQRQQNLLRHRLGGVFVGVSAAAAVIVLAAHEAEPACLALLLGPTRDPEAEDEVEYIDHCLCWLAMEEEVEVHLSTELVILGTVQI